MYELALYAVAGVIVSLLIGGMIGAKIADAKIRRLYAEVRDEMVRVRRVAQDKLAVEEPDLEKLLQDLNRGVEQTYRAAAALENHEKMMIRKTEAGKEITASSRYIIKMIDELSGDVVALSNDDVQTKQLGNDNGKSEKKTPSLK